MHFLSSQSFWKHYPRIFHVVSYQRHGQFFVANSDDSGPKISLSKRHEFPLSRTQIAFMSPGVTIHFLVSKLGLFTFKTLFESNQRSQDSSPHSVEKLARNVEPYRY